MKIISSATHKTLAKSLANAMNCSYIEAHINHFNDGETRVQIFDDTGSSDVVIIHSTSRPVNDNIIALLLLIDIVKRSGAKKITLIVPYFAYSRQDRRSYLFAPISARIIADLFENSGIDNLITIDLHSKQSEGFFRKIALSNLSPVDLFLPRIQQYHNIVIVSPDIGSFVRAYSIKQIMNIEDIIILNKTRSEDRKCVISEIVGANVVNKNCILIDDIVDSGSTLCLAAEILIDQGALSVNAFVTHAVLSSSARDNIGNSSIENIYVTDSIPTDYLPSKFHIISIMPIIKSALEKLYVSI